MRVTAWVLALAWLAVSVGCSSGSNSAGPAANAVRAADSMPTAAGTDTPAAPPATISTAGFAPAPSFTPRSGTPAPAANAAPAGTPATTPVPPEVRTYQALLAAAFAPARLPAGFSGPKVGAATSFLNDLARGHHAVGEVDVLFGGPDNQNAIAYLVFPTAGDAEAVQAGQTPGPDLINPASERIGGLPYLVVCNSFGIENAQNTPFGITLCNAVVGTVEVIGYSQLEYDTGADVHGGNRDHAFALLQAGIAHLESTQPER